MDYKLPIWQEGYHDRWIRDAEEYAKRKDYIEQNPVKAKLVEVAGDYKWSSANGSIAMDSSRFDASTDRG